MDFSELDLTPPLMQGIQDAGFQTCTPVQSKTFSYSLTGKDVCAQSQTGTGKTAAFLITIFQRLCTEPHLKGHQALIIVPTRELAVQIEAEARLLGSHLNLSIGCFYGGVGYTTQEKQLASGVDIIIGTPGRLLDFIGSGKMSLKNVSILIIDEADRLFDMGFIPDLRRILRKTPPSSQRQTMLFSATLSALVRNIASEYMETPEEVAVMPDRITVDTITQELYHVGGDEKISLLLGLLKRENPRNSLIFTNMKCTAAEVARRLSANGFPCQFIIGDLPQNKRQKIIDGLKSGKIRFLVATNVAARGLHVNDLDLVINYDLPEDCEDYIHRIGRTARAGKSGKAISLACENFVHALEAIESYTNTKIPVVWADESLYVEEKASSADKNGYENRNQRGKRGASPRHSSGRQTSGRTSHTEKRAPKAEKRAPAEKKRGPAKQSEKADARPPKHTQTAPSGSMEERLEYYRRKYGDNFKPAESKKPHS